MKKNMLVFNIEEPFEFDDGSVIVRFNYNIESEQDEMHIYDAKFDIITAYTELHPLYKALLELCRAGKRANESRLRAIANRLDDDIELYEDRLCGIERAVVALLRQ